MRRFFASLLIIFLLLPVVACADIEEHYIPEANMVVNIGRDWLYVTKDTKTSNLDLSGTLFNYDGVKNVIAETVDMLNTKAYENVHAVAMGYSFENGLVEIQVGSFETDETREVWDISLIPNPKKLLAQATNLFEVYESKKDVWVGSKTIENGYTILSYTTVNNGRNVSVSFTTYDTSSEDERISIAHELLNDIRFTKKEPKPVSKVGGINGEENESTGLTKWLQKMWSLIERYIAFEVSGWIVMAGIMAVAAVIGFIASLFTKRR